MIFCSVVIIGNSLISPLGEFPTSVSAKPVKLLAAEVDIVLQVFLLLCHRGKLIIQCLQLVGHL